MTNALFVRRRVLYDEVTFLTWVSSKVPLGCPVRFAVRFEKALKNQQQQERERETRDRANRIEHVRQQRVERTQDSSIKPIRRFNTLLDLFDYLKPGDIVFAKRPLDTLNLVGNVPVDGFQTRLGNMLNFELLHEQVFFKGSDGSLQNIGFFGSNDGTIGQDKNFPGNIKSYKFGPVHHNQNINTINFSPQGFFGGGGRLQIDRK